MESVVLLVLALVVAVVCIDAIARLDERPRPRRQRRRTPEDEGVITTEKIIVDLSRRR